MKTIGPDRIIGGIVRSGIGAGFTPDRGNLCIVSGYGWYFYPDL